MKAVKTGRMILLVLSALLVFGIVFWMHQPSVLSISRDDTGILQVDTGDGWAQITSWEKDGVCYFFMPAYTNCEKLAVTEGTLWIDGEEVSVRGKNIPWNEPILLTMSATDILPQWQGMVCFMKSTQIPALHVSIEEAALEQVNADKMVQQRAEIALIEADGSVNYTGTLEYITGRGNSTWYLEKKPYTLQLSDDYPLLGMNSGDKWVLLANTYEGSKIMYKMTMDIAAQIGMAYVPQMEWVDLYINGVYQGNYLLAEKIAVDDGRIEIDDMNKPNEIAREGEVPETFVDNYFKGYETDKNPANITGGYLIEKDFLPYYSQESCGFFTNRLYPFTIKHPSVTTRAEAEYITNFVTEIDNLMAAKDETVLQFIDKESFYRKYLIDEIALNSDSNVTSSYFYKNKDENILYAGPVWDYDGAYGESGDVWMDYTKSVLDVNELRGSENLALDWYNVLCSFEPCKQEIQAEYERILPLYQYYLAEGIDEYRDKIYDSVSMDMVRWDYGAYQAGYYETYDNTVKYLKYFLYHRLIWLNERWDIQYELFSPETTGDMHNVFVHVGEEIYTLEIMDGECVSPELLPQLPNGYEGYAYIRDRRNFSPYLPVYEDQHIEAVRSKE